ncbi:lipid A export permease/ATP-binding protein MsbA [Desulfohalobium retbaense]|uniref:Lipid A ABC exporter, fused ATPase and inner membrane subunits MsbA n=1 Tax=Desulfohalobium retbaense (strain ATCC 49708 / DSM 5692 / JCM 16813 / HR100) TaxID=485915 RepID=C8WZW6_DESRD|nr:lipid A export permease/ATP-binding protein MsbA [Desulfohalobium retbaense]ACV67591.1 lipid A ABC exporter, fused ATPase and inner membrane subunits MsbA [Desulfohalobium retbaense DSM 5692]
MKLQDQPETSSSWQLAKRTFSYFAPYKVRIVLAMLAMIVVAACSGATAFLVKPALDDIFIAKDKTALALIPALIVGVFLLKGAARFLQNYEMNVTGLKVLEKLRQQLYDKMLCLPVRFFDDNQVGNLMARILNDVTQVRSSLPALVTLSREVLTMVGLLIVVFYRDPFLASIAIFVLPLAMYPFYFFGRKIRKLGRRNQAKISNISTFLQEIFSGVKVVKAFAMERREAKRFEAENSRLVSIATRQVVYNEMSSPIMETIGALGMGLVVWYGGKQVIEGASTPGTFFSFMTALIMLYDPVKKLNKANLTIQKALAAAERIFDILDNPQICEEQSGRIEYAPPFQGLAFENVTFHYPDSATPALEHVTFRIEPGEQIAIVGPSGGGKSTLINLIPRFHDPTEGQIVLNGHPVQDYTLASLRRNLGIVSQDNFLFNASIRDNIAYGQEDIDPSKLEKAAQAAYAHDFISNLPNGYETIIGERGVKLSGGQRQRIAIARALLKDPDLLILDEATSALDTESERIVQQALENLMQHRTSLVIAHRLSTVLKADRIIVMQDGKVIDQAPHSILIQRCYLYQRLYNMQFKNNERQKNEHLQTYQQP